MCIPALAKVGIRILVACVAWGQASGERPRTGVQTGPFSIAALAGRVASTALPTLAGGGGEGDAFVRSVRDSTREGRRAASRRIPFRVKQCAQPERPGEERTLTRRHLSGPERKRTAGRELGREPRRCDDGSGAN